MKQVHWYPGHMSKTIRLLKENLSLIDIVFILVDARAPISSMSPVIEELYKDKPKLVIFTKADLADPYYMKKHQLMMEEKKMSVLVVDQFNDNVEKLVLKKALEILEPKIAKEKSKGMIDHKFRCSVVGIPNVGKSTFINRLSGKKAVNVGNKAGVTKNLQWIRINERFELLDTPGMLWPKFENPHTGFALAACKAIKIEILPFDDVCIFIINYLFKHYPDRLFDFYKINQVDDVQGYYELISKKYLFKKIGNEIDYDRVSMQVINDIHNCKLGLLCWDIDESI